jgi:hypothetical protein
MDRPFGGWRAPVSDATIALYAWGRASVILLEAGLVVLTLVLFALFDVFVRACDRL